MAKVEPKPLKSGRALVDTISTYQTTECCDWPIRIEITRMQYNIYYIYRFIFLHLYNVSCVAKSIVIQHLMYLMQDIKRFPNKPCLNISNGLFELWQSFHLKFKCYLKRLAKMCFLMMWPISTCFRHTKYLQNLFNVLRQKV